MRRYLPPSAVNGPVSAWGLYKSDDDQTHSDDLCCRWRLARREPRSRLAQQGYPPPPGRGLFAVAGALSARRLCRRRAPRPGRAGFRRAGRRRRAERAGFDRAAAARPAAGVFRPRWSAGPILSPDDPRYGRPDGPVYSDRGAPQGPILSPNDPRYGRPDGAPGLFRPRCPQGPILSPDDPRYGRPDGRRR